MRLGRWLHEGMMETYVGPTIASALSGILVWLVIRRRVERRDQEVDDLREDVKRLEDKRVGKLEEDREHARNSRGIMRREFADKVSDIRTHFVHKGECIRFRDGMSEQVEQFQGSVLKLERVSERVDAVSKRIEAVSDQQIAVGQDLARLQGQLEGTGQ